MHYLSKAINKGIEKAQASKNVYSCTNPISPLTSSSKEKLLSSICLAGKLKMLTYLGLTQTGFSMKHNMFPEDG